MSCWAQVDGDGTNRPSTFLYNTQSQGLLNPADEAPQGAKAWCLSLRGGVCKATSFLTLLSCVKHHLSQQRRRAAIAHHNTWPTCQLCAVSMTAVGTIKCTRGGWGLVQAGLVSHTGQESKDGKISFHPRLSKKCLQCNLPRVHKRNVYKKRQIQCFGVFWCLLLF